MWQLFMAIAGTTRLPRVLLVDDDAPMRRTLRRLLEAEGFEVLEASTGLMAMAIDHSEIDVVLSDVRMPLVGGLELMRLIGDEHSHLPVILMSGSSEVDARTTLRLGAFDFFEKPLDLERLMRSVKQAVRAASRLRVLVQDAAAEA